MAILAMAGHGQDARGANWRKQASAGESAVRQVTDDRAPAGERICWVCGRHKLAIALTKAVGLEPSGEDRRVQRRVEAALAIRVQGVDSAGESYNDDATALEVSRRGLSFLTPRELALFTPLTIIIPGRGPMRAGQPTDFFTEAAVVRCTKDQDGMNRVGVRFLGASLPIYSAEGA